MAKKYNRKHSSQTWNAQRITQQVFDHEKLIYYKLKCRKLYVYSQVLQHFILEVQNLSNTKVDSAGKKIQLLVYHSDRCNKNVKPELSRIKGGGSISAISICCIDLEISSTVKGMLHLGAKKSTFLVYSHGNA